MKRTASKFNVKEMITNTIIEALKEGVAPWTKCWDARAGSARNGQSGHHYRGVNVILLAIARYQGGFTSNEWYTFKGAKAKGGTIRKGEKATKVIFYKKLVKEQDDGTVSSFPMLRYYNVFNRSQCDGLPEPKVEPKRENPPHEVAEQIVTATGAHIEYGSNRACYYPPTDRIEMPDMEQFKNSAGFYSTEFHELGHWTGHASRLDRDGIADKVFHGSTVYAFEELVAELSSAFLCAEVGIEGDVQHAEYIGHWIERLENDHDFIFKASTRAQEATDFILAFAEVTEDG